MIFLLKMSSSLPCSESQLLLVCRELVGLPRILCQSVLSQPTVQQAWHLLVTALRKTYSLVVSGVRIVKARL